MPPATMTDAADAFTAMQADAVRSMLSGATFKLAETRLEEFGDCIAKELKLLASKSEELMKAKDAVEGVGSTIAGSVASVVNEIAPELNLGLGDVAAWCGNAAAEAAPYVSMVIDYVKMATNLVDVARHGWALYKTEERRAAIATGDPLLAFDSMMGIVAVQLKKEGRDALFRLGSGTLKLTTTALTLGIDWASPVIGVANSVLSLVQQIIARRRDELIVEAANDLLKEPQYSMVRLFEVAPILGCFVIGNLDHSSIIGFSADMFGADGWMDEVESLIKTKVRPLQDLAGEMVRLSRFQLDLDGIGDTPNRCAVDPRIGYLKNLALKAQINQKRKTLVHAIDIATASDPDTMRAALARALSDVRGDSSV